MKRSKNDIYIQREKWKDGYHTVARHGNGKLVASQKWHGRDSTQSVSEVAWRGNIKQNNDVHSYLLHTQNDAGEDRSLSVSTRRLIFVGGKGKEKLDYEPVKRYAANVKYPKYAGRSMNLVATFKWGVRM